jgi:hypothetical protein
LDKLLALETTDANQVLAIDVDMLAFKRLDPIFDFCAGRPFAVQGHWENQGVFHGLQVKEILDRFNLDRIPRFNGGMAYYERSNEYLELLDAMKGAEKDYDSYGFNPFGRGQHASEEVCMLLAMIKLGRFDYLIPQEKQFQHSAAGLVGKLYLDVLKNECKFISRQRYCEFYEPILFHAWRYKDFLIYWRQLENLKKLERFEDEHPTLYMPRWVKWSRSLQRKILRLRGRVYASAWASWAASAASAAAAAAAAFFEGAFFFAPAAPISTPTAPSVKLALIFMRRLSSVSLTVLQLTRSRAHCQRMSIPE